MRRSIVSAILFVVAGIFYLIAAMKGNIPIYYIFSILLLLFQLDFLLLILLLRCCNFLFLVFYYYCLVGFTLKELLLKRK